MKYYWATANFKNAFLKLTTLLYGWKGSFQKRVFEINHIPIGSEIGPYQKRDFEINQIPIRNIFRISILNQKNHYLIKFHPNKFNIIKQGSQEERNS